MEAPCFKNWAGRCSDPCPQGRKHECLCKGDHKPAACTTLKFSEAEKKADFRWNKDELAAVLNRK